MGQAAGLSNGVNNARMAVNVPGGNSDNKVGHTMTVKMNRSGVSSAAFQDVELIRNL
jgi:hypothetical protein